MFRLKSIFKPTGDQPQAIARLTKNLKAGAKYQVLLGVTGSGKTFTIANVIAKIGKPALIIEPNKTLAAQIYQELKEFFPNSGVHYFVSYYDYYQPEAYIPQTDTYIEKDAKINDLIDQLRHAATADILSRKDVLVVASVSCIYGIGDPKEYENVSLEIKTGQTLKRAELLKHLIDLQYQRNEENPVRGHFRTRGNQIEIWLPYGTEKIRITLENDRVQCIERSPLTYKVHDPRQPYFGMKEIRIFPAKHFVTSEAKMALAISNIKKELGERLRELRKAGKSLEAERLEQRTLYDLEMMEESGYCHGIENYSRHLSFRKPGEAPFTLLDYFSYSGHSDVNADFSGRFLVFIDESHLTLPQLKAMSIQDRQRKEVLVEHGFRLPSAIDNRPLTLAEFERKTPQTIYVSATPGPYEMRKITNHKFQIPNKSQITKDKAQTQNPLLVEQLIRPTGLLEPSIEIRPTKNQVKDLITEIKTRLNKNQRTLAVTLTKRLAEELADYLTRGKIKAQWLHSEVKTLERPNILKELREGKYDVIVGVNLLREGLDLPEVALVAILDADKEGFLRNETTLIQTMGRAARHPEGHAILYADKITSSMKSAITEVNRRRKIQEDYNKKHGITPQPIVKGIVEWEFSMKKMAVTEELMLVRDKKLLEKEMKEAARNLDFERAAKIRDLIKNIK